nr:hypothetical protein [Tanacetum cinerariifolium]
MPEVAIAAFIVKDNKILLGRITREVKEETGRDITNIEVLTTANHILSDVHAFTTYMRASLSDPNQTPQNIEPEKCEGWDWYDIKNLPEPMFEPLREMLQSGNFDLFAARY